MTEQQMQEAAQKIEQGMQPFDCVVTVKNNGEYIKVWNCYTGSIMGAYNRKLTEVCTALGMKWKRVRTFGNGMIAAAAWEDQVTPI